MSAGEPAAIDALATSPNDVTLDAFLALGRSVDGLLGDLLAMAERRALAGRPITRELRETIQRARQSQVDLQRQLAKHATPTRWPMELAR